MLKVILICVLSIQASGINDVTPDLLEKLAVRSLKFDPKLEIGLFQNVLDELVKNKKWNNATVILLSNLATETQQENYLNELIEFLDSPNKTTQNLAAMMLIECSKKFIKEKRIEFAGKAALAVYQYLSKTQTKEIDVTDLDITLLKETGMDPPRYRTLEVAPLDIEDFIILKLIFAEYQKKGRHKNTRKALRRFQEKAKAIEQIAESYHPMVRLELLENLNDKAWELLRDGKGIEAVVPAMTGLLLAETVRGRMHSDTLWSLNTLAESFEISGYTRRAEVLIEEVRKRSEEYNIRNSDTYYVYLLGIGLHNLRRRNFIEAEKMLHSVYENFSGRPPRPLFYPRAGWPYNAARVMGILYSSFGKTQQAKNFNRNAQKLLGRKPKKEEYKQILKEMTDRLYRESIKKNAKNSTPNTSGFRETMQLKQVFGDEEILDQIFYHFNFDQLTKYFVFKSSENLAIKHYFLGVLEQDSNMTRLGLTLKTLKMPQLEKYRSAIQSVSRSKHDNDLNLHIGRLWLDIGDLAMAKKYYNHLELKDKFTWDLASGSFETGLDTVLEILQEHKGNIVRGDESRNYLYQLLSQFPKEFKDQGPLVFSSHLKLAPRSIINRAIKHQLFLSSSDIITKTIMEEQVILESELSCQAFLFNIGHKSGLFSGKLSPAAEIKEIFARAFNQSIMDLGGPNSDGYFAGLNWDRRHPDTVPLYEMIYYFMGGSESLRRLRHFNYADMLNFPELCKKSEKDILKIAKEYRRLESLPLNSVQILSTLPHDTIFFEITPYQSSQFSNSPNEKRYFAFLIKKNKAGESIHFSDLGETKKIDKLFAKKREALLAQKDTSKIGQLLYQTLFGSFEVNFKNVNRIVISVPPSLSKLPFETIKYLNGGYLIDDSDIVYCSSGRLIEQSVIAKSNLNDTRPSLGKGLIMSGPQYNRKKARPTVSGIPKGGLRNGKLAPLQNLPYFIAEGETIFRLSKNHANFYTGANVNKTTLLSNPHPQFLHIVTHGFYIESPYMENEDLKKLPWVNIAPPEKVYAARNNPLLRSGLAFTGFNNLVFGDAFNPGLDTGLLTASTVEKLDMRGTEVVVLSACETALGDMGGNLGVLGLRRSFRIAGAKSIVMSLWPVSDAISYKLMKYFYSYYFQGLTPTKSLNMARRKLKDSLRGTEYDHPYFWSSFVIEGVSF